MVGKDNGVAADVERLARAEQFVGELRAQKGMTAAAGAVEHYDRIGDMPVTATPRCSEGRDVDAQLIHLLAGSDTEVAKDDILLLHLRGIVDIRHRGRRSDERR